MDVGITTFETKRKRITLLDAPGHRDFVPNMISGAAQADVAILVIDAIGFEAGFESDGQTREHVLLAKSLGVSQIGVVINKLDLVQWSKDRFDLIVSKLGPFLKQTGFKQPWFLPISGLSGENMVERKESKLEWFTGATLLEKIDEFQVLAKWKLRLKSRRALGKLRSR
jgi:elongation factor 1 alpha-like protein